MNMPKRRRLRARMAITLAAVLLPYAGVELAHWRLKALGDPPPIEFPAAPISQSEVEQFLDDDFRLIKEMEALPKPILRAFTENGGSRLTIADPGKRYHATDIVWDPSLPWKRLVFAGLSRNKCFLLYEEGGRAHFYVLALFTLSPPNLLKPIWQGSCEPAADIAELRSNVSMRMCSQPLPFYSVRHVTDH